MPAGAAVDTNVPAKGAGDTKHIRQEGKRRIGTPPEPGSLGYYCCARRFAANEYRGSRYGSFGWVPQQKNDEEAWLSQVGLRQWGGEKGTRFSLKRSCPTTAHRNPQET